MHLYRKGGDTAENDALTGLETGGIINVIRAGIGENTAEDYDSGAVKRAYACGAVNIQRHVDINCA